MPRSNSKDFLFLKDSTLNSEFSKARIPDRSFAGKELNDNELSNVSGGINNTEAAKLKKGDTVHIKSGQYAGKDGIVDHVEFISVKGSSITKVFVSIDNKIVEIQPQYLK